MHHGEVKIGLGLYCGLVIYLSSLTPGDLPEGGFAVSDKILHFIEYAIMVAAWGIWQEWRRVSWGLFAFCACFGVAH